MFGKISDVRNKMLLRAAVKRGLKLGREVRIIGKPDFGSEPYLVQIGDHVTVSSNVTFVTHDGGTWVFRYRPEYAGMQRFGRIAIGNNCFIGARAIIMPGVRIGDNC
ncbi:MAG: DapH/DapD/GlmU-related protein, partial [Chloroflexota bacterium]